MRTAVSGRLAGRSVLKMNGIGNKIVILDLRGTDLVLTADEVRAIDAQPGLAFDQLMALHDARTSGTDAFVRIYNADGSEAGACGNGTRCVAWFLLRDGERETATVETGAGLLACRRLAPERFSVDMGPPRLAWNEIPLRDATLDPSALDFGALDFGGRDLRLPEDLRLPKDLHLPKAFAVGMGNPHAVLFVDHLEDYDLAVLGPVLEHAPVFPARANISLAEVRDRHEIRLKVWERGAGATLACGSAACAVLVAAAATGRTERAAAIDLPGGRLDIAWREDGHVIMTGPVTYEFTAVLELSSPEIAAP
jgi:diaminopimelate epimerase